MNVENNIRQMCREEVELALSNHKPEEKHLKGYMFDSLVYRFKDYQARAFSMEVVDLKNRRNCSELDARKIIEDRHNRDLVRFIQILDEAIGEHD